MPDLNSSTDSYIQELYKSCIGGDDLPSIITEVPNIFKTLQGLIKDKDLSNNNRLLVFAAIGYFFIPDDLFPEEKLGQAGYIDDVILCLTIFNEVISTPLGKEALKRSWKINIEMGEVLNEILLELSKEYNEQYMDVLDYVGLLPDNIDIDLNYD